MGKDYYQVSADDRGYGSSRRDTRRGRRGRRRCCRRRRTIRTGRPACFADFGRGAGRHRGPAEEGVSEVGHQVPPGKALQNRTVQAMPRRSAACNLAPSRV